MRDRVDRGAVGVGVATLGVVIAAVVLLLDWSGKERERIVAVPQPSPLQTTPVIPVKPERSVCVRGATLVPEGEIAMVRVGTRRKPAVPMTATVTGPGGYRSQDSIDDSWQDNDLLSFEFTPPPRPMHGEFCLRNDGERVVDVYAAVDAMTIVDTFVGDTPVGPNMQLAFRAEEPASLRSHAGELVERTTLFRPGIVVTPLMWAMFALVLLALTAGIGLAMWRAVGTPDDERSG